MTDWVKYSDAWIGSPDIEVLGAEAIVLHQSALSLASRHRTDGWVAHQLMRHLFPVADPESVIAVLVDAGLWEVRPDGYHLTKWADHLLSRDELKRRADANRESSERYRRCKSGDHSMCDRCAAVRAGRKAGGDRSHDASGDGSRDGPVMSLVSPLSDSSRIASTRNEVERGSEERREGGSDTEDDGSAPLAAVSSPPPPGEPWLDELPKGELIHVDEIEVRTS